MKITKQEIRTKLKDGYGIFVEATGMSSGSHEWYLEDTEGKDLDEEIRSYGSGQNWSDQDAFVSCTFEEAVDSIYKNRKYIIDICPHYNPYEEDY